jgi:putative alpha-1,2-mannosidase
VRRVGDGDHITRVTLNGMEITRPYLRHAELIAGGELRVEVE